MSFFFEDDDTPRTGRIAAAVVAGILAFILLISLFVAWPFKKVDNGYVGLSYGGGIVEGRHFQGEHVGPTSIFFNGWGDKLYSYPATQRNYIISLNPNEGDRGQADSIEALNSDGVEVTYQVAVYFKLNLDKLEQFHNNIGLKYHAWCDGTAVNCSDGWENMLNDSFRQQLENALQVATRQYHTTDFLTSDTIQSIQGVIAKGLKDDVNAVLGDDYFCGPTFVQGQNQCPDFKVVLKKPTLPDGVVQHFQEVQESKIKIQTKENEVKQARLESEAIRERQQALESCGQTCILYEAIHQGGITFWVIPDNGKLAITTPTGGTP